MSKFSKCELINRFPINIQQVNYIFEFKTNQEICTSMNLHILSDFFLRRTFEIPAKKSYDNVCLHYMQNNQIFQWKKPTVFFTEHTDGLLRLNAEQFLSFLFGLLN